MTTQEAARFLIAQGPLMQAYRSWPDNPYWAHAMICRWHRDQDGLVAWDQPPYPQEVK